MDQRISQEDIRKIIISDMVKKRNSIVPIIGEDMIVYKGKGSGEEGSVLLDDKGRECGVKQSRLCYFEGPHRRGEGFVAFFMIRLCHLPSLVGMSD